MLKKTLVGLWLQIFWSATQSNVALASRYACCSSSTRRRSASEPPSKTMSCATVGLLSCRAASAGRDCPTAPPLACALGQRLEIQELAPHHHEVAPWQHPPHHEPREASRVPHHDLREQATARRAFGKDQIGHGEVAEEAEGAGAVLDAQGEVPALREIHEGEDVHHRLPDGEMLQPGRERPRALTAAVVDPVVGIRRNA